MRIAVIDIGSNSVLMSIIEIELSKKSLTRPQEIFTDVRITRLARRISFSDRLESLSKKETLSTLREYKQICGDFRADKILAVATSALREAVDGSEFIRQIQDELNFTPEIISGEREARLTALATQFEFPEFRHFALLDVGGGSTEIVESSDGKVTHLFSLPLGTVRNTEKWIQKDPPDTENITNIQALISEELKGITFRTDNLISVGGTATTLYCIQYSIEPYDPKKVHHGVLSLEELTGLRALLQKLPPEKRQKLPGLHPKRADVILMGSLIIEKFMKKYGFKNFHVSNRGLRWGLVYEYLLNNGTILS